MRISTVGRSIAPGGVFDQGEDINDVITFMKTAGFSPIDCIRGVMVLTGMTLRESTLVMINSDAWSHLK